MRLEYRFTIIILICLIIGMGAAGLISYRIETQQAQAEILHNADFMMETAVAIRSYTINEVRPLLNQQKTDEFLPQTVPSYSAQSTLGHLKKRFPEFTYREVALNPTNVSNRASDWEVGLIRRFQTDAKATTLSGVIGQGSAGKFYFARPIRITNPSCLVCHSVPNAAPKAMLAKYGTSNGFGWKMNEVVGAQVVEVPVERAWKAAKNSIAITMGALTCIFLLTFVVFQLMLRRYVIRPLEAITQVTEDISLDKRTGKVNANLIGGQYKRLEQAIERLRVSVEHAVEMIGRRK